MNNARRDAEWLAHNRPAKAPASYDHINPSHYKGDREFEPIDVIEDWGLNYHLGNALKYIARSGRKPGEDIRQGLSKAIWYLERYSDELLEEQRAARDADEIIARRNDHMVELTLADDFIPFDATDDLQEDIEFQALGDRFNEIPSSVLPGPDDYLGDIYAAEADYFGNYRKDLTKFEDHEIYQTHYVDGSILGTQKNGDVRVLGKYDQSLRNTWRNRWSDRNYAEILAADPLDLAPSEFEPEQGDPWVNLPDH